MWRVRALLLAAVSVISAVRASSHRHHRNQHRRHGHHGHGLSRHAHHIDTSLDDEQYAAAFFRKLVHRNFRQPTRRLRHKELSLARLKAPDFPAAHPIVRQVLDGMDGSINKLKDKRKEQNDNQEKLAQSESDAMAHIPDAVTMQHNIVRMEADLRIKDDKLKRLEDEEGGLKGEHEKLHSKLSAAIEPRIFAKKEKLEQQQAVLTKTEKDLASWKKLQDEYREAANTKLQERKRTLLLVRDAETAVKAAEEQQQQAEDTYQKARREARKGVEQFKYVDVKYDAEMTKDQEETEEVHKDEDSVTKLSGVFKMEDQRIDESLYYAKDRLQTRISKAKLEREKQNELLTSLKARYGTWQEDEEKLTGEAAKQKAAYGKSAEAYQDERSNVLHAAQDAAAAQVVGDSDWASDDWALADGADTGLSKLEDVPVAPSLLAEDDDE